MGRLNVNPTRMEMQKQKGRLNIASRGHKLLKNKSDEMIRHFLRIIRENKKLRDQVESELSRALHMFVLARTQTTNQQIEQALLQPTNTVKFEFSTKNIMGLEVPKLTLSDEVIEKKQLIKITTNPNFDRATEMLAEVFPKILELANIEKACDMLAIAIEESRRRINAIEHILIPQIQETIKFIKMKLSENERAQQVRLMKVKEMLEQQT